MSTTPRFALIGASGFVAPRHMRAMRETGGDLVAALDPSDSVGVIDSYFPDASFFVEFERFDRHLDKLHRKGAGVDYVSICSPNYLHDAHVRFALRSHADAICEKPLVLNPWNIDGLAELEVATGHKVHTILQLRLHPAILALRDKIANENGRRHQVELTYITSRGRWYQVSWKGDERKSGGIATNIGVHFFDMIQWLFGDFGDVKVYLNEKGRMSGFVELERAKVNWFLSVNGDDLPVPVKPGEPMTYRSITIDGEEVEFSGGFTDLHTRVYERTLQGEGFGIEDARGSIELTYQIRQAKLSPLDDQAHPLLRK